MPNASQVIFTVKEKRFPQKLNIPDNYQETLSEPNEWLAEKFPIFAIVGAIVLVGIDLLVGNSLDRGSYSLLVIDLVFSILYIFYVTHTPSFLKRTKIYFYSDNVYIPFFYNGDKNTSDNLFLYYTEITRIYHLKNKRKQGLVPLLTFTDDFLVVEDKTGRQVEITSLNDDEFPMKKLFLKNLQHFLKESGKEIEIERFEWVKDKLS